MSEGMTCYERDEALCEDQMCLRTGCRLRNERLSPMTPPTKAMLELADESMADELERLVSEYATGEGSEREEAWNLIADFAFENSLEIAKALRSSQNGERERVIEEALEKMECDCRGAHREYLKMQSRTVSPLTIANIYERIADELDAIRALKSGEKGS